MVVGVVCDHRTRVVDRARGPLSWQNHNAEGGNCPVRQSNLGRVPRASSLQSSTANAATRIGEGVSGNGGELPLVRVVVVEGELDDPE